MTFDWYRSEAQGLVRGIDQGCPLSGITFQFYNADLLEIKDEKNSEEAVTFINDALPLVRGKTLEETNGKLKDMMEWARGGMDWSDTHQCNFVLNKFGVMGLTRRREPTAGGRPATRPVRHKPISLHGVEVLVVDAHNFLGVIIDQELRWKDQVN